MRPLAALLSGVAVYVACVGSAAAQGGAGLYEPFPQPADPSVSRAFVGELRAPGPRLANELSAAELERGTRVRSEDLPAGLVAPRRRGPGAERARRAWSVSWKRRGLARGQRRCSRSPAVGRAPARSPVSRRQRPPSRPRSLVVAAGCGGDDGKPGTDREPAGPKPPFFGVVAEDVLAGDADYRRAMLARQRAAGVRLIRQTFHWDRIERSPGRYDFREYDAYVADVARAGMRSASDPVHAAAVPRDGRRSARNLPARPAAGHGGIRRPPRSALRARRAVLGVQPRSPVAPDPRLAGLERAEPAGLLAERARPGRVRGAAAGGRSVRSSASRPAGGGRERRPQREQPGDPLRGLRQRHVRRRGR